MKAAIMQPYLFPYIGYWQLIQAVDIFVIYDDVNYIMRGWVNRNNILEQGRRKLFTLETSGASQNKLINQVSVGQNAGSLLKTFHQNYQKAPYFDPVIKMLSELLLSDEKNLARLISATIRRICSYLMIDTQLIVSSEVFANSGLKGADRIVDICKRLGADEYINAIGGKALYGKEFFLDQGIRLFFIESAPVEYGQFGAPFVPGLSIVDVMMFNPPETIQKYLRSYQLT